jgi:hypothetical protein
MNYEVISTSENEKIIKATDASGKIWWIPIDPENTMYQAYLAWQASQ